MIVTIGYTIITSGEITVNVPDGTPNPTVEAMRLAREQNADIRHAAAIEVKSVRKEADSDNQSTHSATA